MSIQGTIKFVNPTKENPNTGKMGQSIKVAIPGEDIYVNGKANSFDHLQKDQQVMVEKDGQWWRLSKDQTGASAAPAQSAPMSSTPATVTGGQGHTATDWDAINGHGAHVTALYIKIAKAIRESELFVSDEVIHAATSTVLINVEKTYRP